MHKHHLLLMLIAGCSGTENVAAQHGRCAALEGKIFTSLGELECGLTPTGVATCHWQLEFRSADIDASTLSWRHSDVEETLRVTCDGAMLTAVASPQRQLNGWYDVETRQLTWEGVAYSE